ncbi:MAG: flagellar protein G [Halohasta sp.]
MASVSASHLIIFIASLVIAAGVVGTLTTGVDRVSSAIDDRSLDVTQQVRMDMAIISDPSDADYDSTSDELTIHVRNTGSQGVPIENAEAVDIVLNGNFVDNDDIEVDDANGDSNVWRPGDVVAITISNEDGDYTVKSTDNRLVLTVNEDQETFEFNT